jgi:hypothetical protein
MQSTAAEWGRNKERTHEQHENEGESTGQEK